MAVVSQEPVALPDVLRKFTVACGDWAKALLDPAYSEVMVNPNRLVFALRAGAMEEIGEEDNVDRLTAGLQFLAGSQGKVFSGDYPILDATLPDGSRIAAQIPPASPDGLCLTIRKVSRRRFNLNDLVGFGAMPHEISELVAEAIRNRQTMIVSGGTDSGKTTLCSAAIQVIPLHERLAILEDVPELSAPHANLVRLQSRKEQRDYDGKLLVPEITMRQLVETCLRSRPDRLIIGEVRDAAAFDLIDALNTGHEGSMSTIHANSPDLALRRLASFAMRANVDIPFESIRENIGDLIRFVVQVTRRDARRFVSEVGLVEGYSREKQQFRLKPVYRLKGE